MIVDKINAFLTKADSFIDEAVLGDIGRMAMYSFERQFGPQKKSEPKVRLSSIGRCLRQQAYKLLGFEENGATIGSRAKMVFFMGDLTELTVIALAKASGCVIENTGTDQKVVEIDGIQGHPDGIYVDQDGTRYLLEVKSMSSYAFAEFERGVLDEGYRFQNNSYMHALGLNQAIIVALNKDAGVLGERIELKNKAVVADIRTRIKTLKEVTKETLPDRPYLPNAKGFLPWQCLYCSHHVTCWPNAEKVVVNKTYKLKIKQEAPIETP